MNFKKSKDVKRSSYYVWFLGAKESKGLRGDEYVTPVLSYLIDNECEFEPSKVTLQVSNKGLKIIQILTVPRKSSKLNADQQTQLFANSRRSIAEPPSSSVLKTEQVKHHIPHNSITWIYQEDDVICAILLLYNPITRCPVHVHAYRCDSIETADNLRQQLQTLVDKPENQKKFREIESRLAAKGLLLPPHSYNYLEDDMAASNRQSFPTRQSNAHPFNSPTNSKTLNSDGRSTRTEGSDENSEESNSSDLGYGIRSIKNNHISNDGFKRIPAPPPMNHSLADMKKSFSINDPSPLDLFTPKNKSSNKSKPKKALPEEAEIPVGVTALYDSLAAELRAKLGNPKMGPILLPPRDYESTASRLASAKNNDKKHSNAKDKSCLLTRSESSGKSSSGIGSDEALSTENKKSSSQYYRRFESDRHQPQSFIDIEQHKRSNRFLYPHHDEKEKKLYSLQVYSSDEENFGSADALDTEDIEENVIFSTSSASKSKSTFDLPSYQPPHQSSHRSSNQPLPGQKYRRHHQPAPVDSYADRKVKDTAMSKLYASHPNLVRAPPAHQMSELKENNSNNHKSSFVIGRREQRTMQQVNQHNGSSSNNSNNNSSKMDRSHTASKEMPLSSMPNQNVNKMGKSNSKTAATSHPASKPIQKFYFADAEFSDPSKTSSSRTPQSKFSHSQQQHSSSNYRSNGNLPNLDYGNNGPTSLNYHYVNRRESPPQQPPLLPQQRSISPYFYSHQDDFDILPKSSSSKHFSPSHQTSKPHNSQSGNKKSSTSSAINSRGYEDRGYGEIHHPHPAMRSKFKDQPYSRYSYIDVDHHSNEARMGFFKR